MIDDRYQAPVDPPRDDLLTAEQREQRAIEEAERLLKEEPFQWEEPE